MPRWLPLCLLLALVACHPAATLKKTAPLPRPEPGYMFWMHKQSMLGHVQELIAEVSQSKRLWLHSGESRHADVLLAAAPSWLELVGVPANPATPAFRELSGQIASASTMGFGGIYLGETGERPDIWTSKDGKNTSQKTASFYFDARFGSDADFNKLAQIAESAGLELGSDLLAGATGRGPDFFLQARNAPDHAGLYALLPVPEEAVPLLPLTHEEWDGEALSPETVAKLADAGILPNQIARESLPWASKSGWAATGPVMGADGRPRRWLYRFAEDPSQPVLSWHDPSGQTTKVFYAAAIRHTGLLGQSLAGLHFEALMALEPGTQPSLSPGLDALNEISRQIHRYGGWAMQADPLPLNAIQQVMAGPCDFCRDEITPLLVAYGLLCGDRRPLSLFYQGLISSNLDISRLARGYNASAGLIVRILYDNPAWVFPARKLAETGPALTFTQLVKQIYPNPSDAQIDKIRHFLLSWRLGLPGLGFVEFYPGSLAAPSDGWLEHILTARRACGLAKGKVVSTIRGRGGALGILSRLPDGGYWLLACNFGRNPDQLNFFLPSQVRNAVDASSAKSLSGNLNGQNFHISLGSQDATNVLFEPGFPPPRIRKTVSTPQISSPAIQEPSSVPDSGGLQPAINMDESSNDASGVSPTPGMPAQSPAISIDKPETATINPESELPANPPESAPTENIAPSSENPIDKGKRHE